MLRVDSNNITNHSSTRVSNLNSKLENSERKKGNSFESTLKAKSSEDLAKILKDIKDKGKRLIKSQNYMDALSYKKVIQNYLSEVVNHMYTVTKGSSFWGNKYYSVVEVIDKELESMTSALLSNEKENIDILKNIDKIEGLLVELVA